ncbi:fatty-acid amide hydrolase 2-A-like isoform X2 [Aethina tumida]|uniref:fatty-acid amide hydrolase 2-A-like isoform X2 n=1 Tax=Aethina tumida TaxID=116153 RepID=UPI00096B2EE9|nr:fatty-acid amide hydrolase 2-A-like isoform X2 [Aethina tumida]
MNRIKHLFTMEIFLYTAMGLLRILHFLSHPVYAYFSKGKKKSVPPIKNDLLTISATDLAAKIRERKIKSVDLCKAYIERIKEVESIINAVVEERFEEALEDARKVDNYIANCSDATILELEKIKPLFGVPFTVKESCSLKGMSLSVGSLTREGYKADQDGECVAAVKASGAIPLLVSNTPELCLSWESFNLIKGVTRNPYDISRSSAGSSGGEGALLGAGASVIGIGSDIAGSIRVPALFNGIFGHKPTPRIAPIKGHYPFCSDPRYPDFLVVGPMTRYAKDLKLLLKIMVGDKSDDLRLDEPVDIGDLNVYVMEDAGFMMTVASVETAIKKSVKRSAKYLSDKFGCTIIKDNTFAELADSNEIGGSVLYAIEDIPNVLKWDNSKLPIELLKSIMGHSKYSLNVLTFYIVQHIYNNFVSDHSVQNAALKRLFIEKLGTNGVLIYPTWTNTASKHHEFYFHLASIMYVMMANTLGLPATHVPCGLDKNGLPVGIQVIAAPNQDRLCLAVAEELEKGFGGWVPPGH